MKRLLKISIFIVSICVLSACSSSGGKHVTIGAKDFTEQFILSKMAVFLLEDHGFKVDEMDNLGSSVLRKTMETGQIDMMWEYTGTALTTYLKQDPISNPDKSFQKVKKMDAKQNDIAWMNKSNVNNTYCLLMDKKEARKLGIKTISDLADYINKHPGKMTMGTDAEFGSRADGLKGVETKYGFQFGAKQIKQMQIGLYYKALHNGAVDVVAGFQTDSGIKKYNLLVLKDDKKFFPVYDAALSVDADIYKKYPEIKKITKPLAEKLNSDVMRELNYKVDVEGKNVSVVAHNWLVKNGLLEK
ncbi:osmoprotectant transport system substrate-binding protein [Scopulibacillus darangshiensis]|uniref:Osmoprotectant transport system substrate-binding protein n=1 Tax=Scopulibacillus darangshiensis TaxID=442528 RepID=A0A4R2P5L0_9BACL|nr:glycine betaine ABC transporter substrate-binding protein [Scopulibacillus darangshiensis]TCP29488.1 osmoprotectant transport system substrate-binding protein [Scopulibacillus darangshiensis]